MVSQEPKEVCWSLKLNIHLGRIKLKLTKIRELERHFRWKTRGWFEGWLGFKKSTGEDAAMALNFFYPIMSSTNGANQSCITWKRKKNLCESEGWRKVYGSLMSGHINISCFANKCNKWKKSILLTIVHQYF